MTYDDIDRDILASLGVHFQAAFAGFLPVFFEGQHMDGAYPADYLEVRVEGPTIDEIAKEQYQVTAEVDIKIVRRKTNNLLTIRSDAGKCAEALRLGIPYRHPVWVFMAEATAGGTPAEDAPLAVDESIAITTIDSYPYVVLVGGMTYADSVLVTEHPVAQEVILGCLTTQSFYGRRHKIETIHHGQLKNKHILVSQVSTTLSILL